MLNLADRMCEGLGQCTSDEALTAAIESMAAATGDEVFARRVAREIIAHTQPQQAIPAVYARYRPVVRDGIEFFISQVSRRRLVALAVSQLKLGPGVGHRERLLELAKRFPTLHKMGQLIARNPHIDPAVKNWLIHLENGIYGTPANGVREWIVSQLTTTGSADQVQVQPSILAEASVGAVMRFSWHSSSSREPVQGVGKVLKPGIRGQLDEELAILEKTAAFFENHRHRYPFKDFRFLEVFQEVRRMLVNEVDLAAEQTHLADAMDFFGTMAHIQVPRVLPFSTAAMTAMTYLQGPKITDAALGSAERKRLAGILFETLVCKPLFGRQASSLFHGDPHAGNILALTDPASGRPAIGLIDWSLAGRLDRSDRVKTVQLIQAVIKQDLGGIRRAVKALALETSWNGRRWRQAFRKLVLDLMHSPAFARLTQIKKTFKLLEELAYEGFVFPADLMLFRKAMFTLEGVIYDLCPEFDMDAAVTGHLAALIADEMPSRIGNLFFPLADRPENYTSLISNLELQSLLVHRYIEGLNAGHRALAALFWGRGADDRHNQLPRA